ncbi:RES family NAD+ phosphorylase [Hymenobacter aerilatus]|uniref:RES family NAD+ phosphorylase n=1 Tax=Hymenobacter aerilatus TaxID=2932251 RepID=A0A8T9SYP6_9BACT|nr:RES family NAD+ phosphorylase [Hymenobacter aerilatus]UOR07372.1 RES family NAD+ phosphorylase [Hymenobacter aerilatus]
MTARTPSNDPQATVPHQIAALQQLDLRQHSIEELTDRVRNLLEQQELQCLEFPAGLLLYRGIVSKDLPATLADVSYPPANRVIADQRANRAGQPMFYCSATWHPPFFEAGVQPGDQIVISRWQTQQPLRLASFGYADRCIDDPHTDRQKALRDALADLPAPRRQLAAFLTDLFTRTVHDDNQHHYRLSIAVAEACQLGTAFDGLLYPSAAMPSPAHNLALHPAYVEEDKLVLQYVEHLRVHQVGTETLDVCSLNFAREVTPDGHLCWINQPGNWVLREGAKATNCRFVAGSWLPS